MTPLNCERDELKSECCCEEPKIEEGKELGEILGRWASSE